MRVVKLAVVGAGHRGIGYAKFTQNLPFPVKIVGVADPDPDRRQCVRDLFGLDEKRCFTSAAALAAAPKFADGVINGTLDHMHVPTTLPLLEAGYHVLLEKPFAVNEKEMRVLLNSARRHKRHVIICHVLRHAPFYHAIKKRVLAGDIGDIINIQTVEHVSFHHMATAYVRGKHSRFDKAQSGMLMAKCCHDLDLIAWMKSGICPVAVASFGGLMHFRSKYAPTASGKRCLVDCQIERSCPYSARKIHIDCNWWGFAAWEGAKFAGDSGAATRMQKVQFMRAKSPIGRCVWRCDNDVVDHQSLIINFKDGATATHNMVGGTAKPTRKIMLVGTHGEIEGEFDAARFVIRTPAPKPGRSIFCFKEEEILLEKSGDYHGMRGGHGGGDERLVGDFVKIIMGKPPSISTTSLEDSINGHLIGFYAEKSRLKNRVVPIPEFRA